MAVALPRANVVRILRCLRPLLYFFTEMKHTGTLFMTYACRAILRAILAQFCAILRNYSDAVSTTSGTRSS